MVVQGRMDEMDEPPLRGFETPWQWHHLLLHHLQRLRLYGAIAITIFLVMICEPAAMAAGQVVPVGRQYGCVKASLKALRFFGLKVR